MTKVKSKLLLVVQETQKSMGLDELQETSNLIPIINCVINDTFARKDKKKNAISHKSWNLPN